MRTTLEEEWLELWDGLLDGIGEAGVDPARDAACAFLLRRLIDSMGAAAIRQRLAG